MHLAPSPEAARILARMIVSSMLDKTRSVFAKYSNIKNYIRRELGLEAVGVGELVECRKLVEARSSGALDSDPNLPMLFHGTVVEKGVREELNLQKGDLVFRRVGNYVLFGSSDAVLEICDMTVPVEIKSSLAFTIPRDSHFLQCSLYAFLYRSPYGVLLYISKKFRIYVVPAVSEETVRRLITLWYSTCPLFLEECNHCQLKKCNMCQGGDRDYYKRSWLYGLVHSLRRVSPEVVLERDTVADIVRELKSNNNKSFKRS